MKQVLQALRSGEIEAADVPCPRVSPGHLLIQTRASLISAGTERVIVEFSKASLAAKARQKPERVKQVLDKIRTDGLLPTLEAVFARLDQPMPLGYCNAGVVVEIGRGVENFKPGDGVVSNGQHAEIVNVPVNLCAKTPDGVPDEQAAFTVLGAIALQGIRLLNPTLGESIVVTGLGLVGLLTVQLLVANGCRVLGIDIDPSRLKLAEQFGAQAVDLSAGADAVASATAFSQGRGVDGVLVTASAKDDNIMHESAQMCRKRGRVVLVGAVGLNLHRSDFYEKELTFQVSCSYGPGRYDPSYESGGQDYPLSFVRWTEQRNFEAVSKLMESGRLDVNSLISHRIKQSNAAEAYRLLIDGRDVLGIVLTYPDKEVSRAQVVTLRRPSATMEPAGKIVVGMIGAGNFAKAVLLPALKRCNVEMHTIASAGGVTALHAGRKFGFRQTTTDPNGLLSDPAINLTVIATRHDAHARLAVDSLEAGKHTFVGKPL
ncbi:MAG: bi-domain-containing oxidoreductase, partial [Planctomycetes bacterium]|nr:bi-domain-containing oxidoreductase [Planctomycetota bacterium]